MAQSKNDRKKMKVSLKHLMIIASVVMFLLAFCPQWFIDKPTEMYEISPRARSIRLSGLPPIGHLILRCLIASAFLSAAAFFFYSQKLAKSLICNDDIVRVRRGFRFCHYFLLTAGLLSIAQSTLAIVGLSYIENVKYAHLVHSAFFDGLTCICIYISFFLCIRKYIKDFDLFYAARHTQSQTTEGGPFS